MILQEDNYLLTTNGRSDSFIPKPKKGCSVYRENQKNIQELAELDCGGTNSQIKPDTQRLS